MSATYLGGKSVGEAIPALSLALAQVASLLAPQSARAADVSARLASPFVPPDPLPLATALASQLTNLATILSQLPAADAQARISLAGDLAALQALIAPAEALVARISGAVSAGGLHLYALDGIAGQLGAELATVTGGGLPGGAGPSAQAKALVIATELPTAWAALSSVLRTG